MTTFRKILTYWTETKRIVNGEVKQVTCCCKDPAAGPKDCALASGHKTPCRCDCHRGKTGPGPVKTLSTLILIGASYASTDAVGASVRAASRPVSDMHPALSRAQGGQAGKVEQVLPAVEQRRGGEVSRLLDAIRTVESGGNVNSVGDGGRSRGAYQCGRMAWKDGGGDPATYLVGVLNDAQCRAVMVRYWAKYGATTDEQKARLWNGGPNGMRKRATESYWQRVKAAMAAKESTHD